MLARSTRSGRIIRDYVLPGLVLIGILVAWDFTKPRMTAEPPEPFPKIVDRPNGGVPPWNPNEDINQKNRDSLRESTLKALDAPWSSFCEREGRKALVKSLTTYFMQRGVQHKTYAERWGKDGRDYIAKQWATADDSRIERMVEETFDRGYLAVRDFPDYVIGHLAPVVKDARRDRNACSVTSPR